jgi:uncharacterized 2Fe-2S/4Fe-4S cluster protein (DUF4445 family)
MPQKSPPRNKIRIRIAPAGKWLVVPAGSNLLTILRKAGINLISTCNGNGTCGNCKVITISGRYNEINQTEPSALSKEELDTGIRLACQVNAYSDGAVCIPAQSLSTPQRLQVEGLERHVHLDPAVKAYKIRMKAPSLIDLKADERRIADALKGTTLRNYRIPQTALKDLSVQMRANSWAGQAALNEYKHPNELIGFFPLESRLLGFAMDVGTTKLAGYLVDLEKGTVIAQAGEMNPQIPYGEDVITRIAYAVNTESGRKVLRKSLIGKINEMIHRLCRQTQQSPDRVVSIVLVGNTVMTHLACGLPVKQLGESPFIPAVSGELELLADELGLTTAAAAEVYIPPNIAGYIGSDHLAMQIATRAWKSKQNVVALDIGTNTEISLTSKGKLYCCSCASGPAFEGAHIRFGMRATKGAVERVAIDNGVHVSTIGNAPAIGICGSGILDAVAEMKKSGIIDGRGIFDKSAPGVEDTGTGPQFVLVPQRENGLGRDLVVTRKDVQEIQLAKAAIQTGWQILLREAGISPEEIDEFLVAGAFGTYLDVRSGIAIKIFPEIPIERFKQVGNAAGTGARAMLLSKKQRKQANECRERMEYIELTIHPQFSDTYFKAMYL